MDIKQNPCVAFIHYRHRCRHHHHNHHDDYFFMVHHSCFIIYDRSPVIHHHHSSPFTIITIQHAPFPSSQSSSCILHHSFLNHHLSYHLSCILMSLIPILKLPKILTTCCWCEISTASSPKQSTVTWTAGELKLRKKPAKGHMKPTLNSLSTKSVPIWRGCYRWLPQQLKKTDGCLFFFKWWARGKT